MYKVLLDENLPVKLRYRLQTACEIYTVREKGWNALENGDLVQAMEADSFDYLITSDKNLQYQQNPNKYAIGIIVLKAVDNTYESILPLTDQIKDLLRKNEKVKLTVISSIPQ